MTEPESETLPTSGSGAILAAALTGVTNNTSNVTVTGNDYTVAQLKAINNATTGAIVLDNSGVNLSGLSSDLASALDGSINYAGNVAITNANYTLSELINRKSYHF